MLVMPKTRGDCNQLCSRAGLCMHMSIAITLPLGKNGLTIATPSPDRLVNGQGARHR
jgi:hypothetical protein